jgi:serine/threonine-protein kinase
LRLFLRVCEAVQFAHGRLVVHRDIKPSNILVTAQGEPRLLDFGIARLLEPALGDDVPARTRTGFRLLTPEHAAPEQLRGEPASTAADVYALGVLLFELLAGRRPFVSAHALELQRLILEGAAPAPSSVCLEKADARHLRGDLDRIVLVALRKEPERRYASAGQFAEDVERFLAGRPVQAQRDTLRYRTGKFVRRNRGFVLALCAFVLLLSSFATAMAIQSRRLARERDRAEEQRASAEAVVGMLTRFFDASNPYTAPGGDTLRVSTFLEQGEREIDKLKEQPELQARMWRVLGAIRAGRGQYEQAHALLERAWKRRVELNGADDTLTVAVYHELAGVVASWRSPDSARAMFARSAVQLERALGSKHPDVAIALQDLAGVTRNANERAALLKRAEQVRDTVTNPITRAAALNAEGTNSWNKGLLIEAAAQFQQSLQLLEQHQPPEHPNRLTVTGNLASALSAMGEFRRGETLHRTVLDVRRRVLGEQHSSTALAQEAVALLLAQQGKLAEAEEMLGAALATTRATLAPGHWRIANTIRNIALVRVARGAVAEGLALLDSAIAQHQERGQGHDYMIGQRAVPLLLLGRVDEAARVALTTDSLLRHSGGPANANYLAESAFWVGTMALVQGNAAEAAARFSYALESMKTSYSPTHPRVVGAECALGLALSAQKKTAEANVALRACPAYINYALANPVLTERARQASSRQ